MKLWGIDPATFRFVAQCLSHCGLAVVSGAIHKVVVRNMKLIFISGTFPLWAVSKEITKLVNRDIAVLAFHRC
jgi:hypothetical protein